MSLSHDRRSCIISTVYKQKKVFLKNLNYSCLVTHIHENNGNKLLYFNKTILRVTVIGVMS